MLKTKFVCLFVCLLDNGPIEPPSFCGFRSVLTVIERIRIRISTFLFIFGKMLHFYLEYDVMER